MNIYKNVIGFFIIGFITNANAADLMIVCDIKETSKNQAPSTYKKRFEIHLEPRFFKTSVEVGNGFRKSAEGFPKDVNSTRIVFVEDATTNDYYDRKSSQYFYKNIASGVEAKGPCVKEKN